MISSAVYEKNIKVRGGEKQSVKNKLTKLESHYYAFFGSSEFDSVLRGLNYFSRKELPQELMRELRDLFVHVKGNKEVFKQVVKTQLMSVRTYAGRFVPKFSRSRFNRG